MASSQAWACVSTGPGFVHSSKHFIKHGDKLLCLFSTRIAEVSKQICYRFAQMCEYKDVWCNNKLHSMTTTRLCIHNFVCMRVYWVCAYIQVQENLTWAARSTHIREYEVNFKCSCFNFGARVRPCDWADIASFSKISQSCFHLIFFSHSPTHTKNTYSQNIVEIKFGSWAPSCHCKNTGRTNFWQSAWYHKTIHNKHLTLFYLHVSSAINTRKWPTIAYSLNKMWWIWCEKDPALFSVWSLGVLCILKYCYGSHHQPWCTLSHHLLLRAESLPTRWSQ